MSTKKSKAGKWRIIPSVSYANFSKTYGVGANCFTQWFSVQRFWGGRIISICVKHHQIRLDFRKSWIADMAND